MEIGQALALFKGKYEMIGNCNMVKLSTAIEILMNYATATNLISKCCNASVKFYDSDNGKPYYRCEACGNICDLAEWNKESIQNSLCETCQEVCKSTHKNRYECPLYKPVCECNEPETEKCECWEKLEPGMSLSVDQINPPICSKCKKIIKGFRKPEPLKGIEEIPINYAIEDTREARKINEICQVINKMRNL